MAATSLSKRQKLQKMGINAPGCSAKTEKGRRELERWRDSANRMGSREDKWEVGISDGEDGQSLMLG